MRAAAIPPADAAAAGLSWAVSLPLGRGRAGEPGVAVHGEGCRVATAGVVSVAFDGALYDRHDLATGLALPVETDDALMVAHAWQRWGEAALDRLRGMFLVAVHDTGAGVTTIARDQVGLWPVFHAKHGGRVWVSPNAAALVAEAGLPRRVNRLAIADHLCHRWPDPEETYFEGVRRLPPGRLIRVTATREEQRRYWNPNPLEDGRGWAETGEIDEFEAVFERAVRRPLALGRAGIFLSGGFDSVSVGAFATDVARRTDHRAPLAFSLLFPDPSCNEEVVQRGVARQLGLEQELHPFTEACGGRGVIEAGVDLARSWPQPMLNLWNPAYGFLARRGQARGCRVVLTGNGGDEWLGVSPFLAADLIRRADVPGFVRFLRTQRRSFSASRLDIWRGVVLTYGLRPLAGALLGRVFPSAWRARRARRFIGSTPAWIAPDTTLRRQMDARAARNLDEPNPPHGFYWRELRTALDHPLMAIEAEEGFELGQRSGVRILHPYWDVDLIDLLMRIPPRQLNRGGRSKGMVRGLVAKRFPQLGFESHRKVSASGFYHRILREEGPRVWRSMGGPRELARLEIVDREVLESILHGMTQGGRPGGLYRFWDVLGLESWVRAQG